ncbi:hypothetical protein [Radiobacillus kanasensis]|uniref:hypothetical protein n=1 Tax=Radiobacillus kanasensis TaxID=2844358 RepID=UPI0038B66217
MPKKKENYQKWGTRSDGRDLIDERNMDIEIAFNSGKSIFYLVNKYSLSIEQSKRLFILKIE